jgi:hypothetical protein
MGLSVIMLAYPAASCGECACNRFQALAEQATLSLEQTLHWNTMMVFYPLCERLNGRTKPHIIECRNIPCFF